MSWCEYRELGTAAGGGYASRLVKFGDKPFGRRSTKSLFEHGGYLPPVEFRGVEEHAQAIVKVPVAAACYAMPVRQIGVDPKPYLIAIGTEVRRRRESVHLSQVKLAKLAKLHPNVIGRLERGIYNPTVITLCSIAGALNTTLVGILARTDTTPRARNAKLKAG